VCAVCQNPIPYPYPCYPFWKHCRYSHTRAEPYSFKDVKPEREVSKVAGGLQDGRIQTWYCLNRAAIDAAGFAAFMASVRSQWLDPGWEQEVKLIILGSSQGLTPISDWIMLVESMNA